MAYQQYGAEGEGPRGITGRREKKKEIKSHVVIERKDLKNIMMM